MQVGDVFGQLTVTVMGTINITCICTCGTVREYYRQNVRRGNTKSCGCTANVRMGLGRITHGATRGKEQTGAYMSWRKMIERVRYPQFNPGYIGITICDSWLKFENFLADMGERPEACSLDRIDPNGNYEPENCRWASAMQQSQNRRPWKHTPEGLVRINAGR
jgi:hypothetical protein